MGSAPGLHARPAPHSAAMAVAAHLQVTIAAILTQGGRPQVAAQSKKASVRIWVLRFTPREISSRFSSVIIAPLPTR